MNWRTKPAGSGAHRHPHRNLLLPRLGAGQQKIGHVHAGDQQHESDRAQDHQHRRLDRAHDLFLHPEGEQRMIVRMDGVEVVRAALAPGA